MKWSKKGILRCLDNSSLKKNNNRKIQKLRQKVIFFIIKVKKKPFPHFNIKGVHPYLSRAIWFKRGAGRFLYYNEENFSP